MSELERQVALAVEGDRAAVEHVIVFLSADIYRLSLRMLGSPADAQDASQEILIKIVTHLGSFRGHSSLRTWAWKIATRHLLRTRRGRDRQRTASFDEIEALIDAGAHADSTLVSEHDAPRLAEEVRLGCTQAMLGALRPAQRVAYILSDVFGLESAAAAHVLQIDVVTFRKRLQRARGLLATFMERKCGLANPVAACRCVRQIPVAVERRIVDRDKLVLASQPRAAKSLPVLEAWAEMTQIDRAARIFQERANELAPAGLITELRALIDSRKFRILDA